MYQINPRCSANARISLDYLPNGPDFIAAVDSYMQSRITKGVPSLFSDLKHLLKTSTTKRDSIRELVQKYLKNLRTSSSSFNGWVHFFMSLVVKQSQISHLLYVSVFFDAALGKLRHPPRCYGQCFWPPKCTISATKTRKPSL